MTYHFVDDYINRRVPLRPEHLKLAAEAHARGEMLMGGALTDPDGKALAIFRAADRTVVENFVCNDPYVKNGLVVRWEVQPWMVMIGNSESAAT
jgi:uncharacterized protein YciI